MDSQDYLDQISQSNRPTGPSGIMKIISSKYFKWGMAALALLIIIMIVGSMLGRGVTMREKCRDLKLRLEETEKVMEEYQQYIKSSSLRSLSASLRGVYANTATQLNNFMISAYGSGSESESKKDAAAAETAAFNAEVLADELFGAKINGLLDRTFAHKMALEIYSVASDEKGIVNSTNEAELKNILSSSYDSLNNLYTQFNEFSETRN